MASVALQIELAMIELLGASGSPAPVARGSRAEYTADAMPGFNLASLESSNNYGSRATDDEGLEVKKTWGVFCYAAANSGIKAADAVDPLLVWVHQRLADNALGGLVRSLQVSGEKWNWDHDSGLDVVEVMLAVEAIFDVARNDPSLNYNAQGD